MKRANYGPFYAAGLYPKVAEVFRSHGYALAVHGSLANDFDLIAVPWVETVSDPQEVIADLVSKFAFEKEAPEPTNQPHGRVSFTVPFSFAECRMDISFTPRKP